MRFPSKIPEYADIEDECGINNFFFVDTGAIYEEEYALAVPTNIKILLAGTAVEWAWIEFTILIYPYFLPSSGDKNGTKDGTKSGTKKARL